MVWLCFVGMVSCGLRLRGWWRGRVWRFVWVMVMGRMWWLDPGLWFCCTFHFIEPGVRIVVELVISKMGSMWCQKAGRSWGMACMGYFIPSPRILLNTFCKL